MTTPSVSGSVSGNGGGPGRSGAPAGRSQQVGVHDPPVPLAGLGAHAAHLVHDVGESPVHELLVGRAEVGAPPQLEVGVGTSELRAREVPVEHDDDVAERGVVLVESRRPVVMWIGAPMRFSGMRWRAASSCGALIPAMTSCSTATPAAAYRSTSASTTRIVES